MKIATLLLPLCGLLFAGCVSPQSPVVANREIAWYDRTDARAFFESERKRGVIYFLGLYNPALKPAWPVPGILRGNPYLTKTDTWLIPSGRYRDPDLNRRFLASAEKFASRYNPLVLEHLKQQRPP